MSRGGKRKRNSIAEQFIPHPVRMLEFSSLSSDELIGAARVGARRNRTRTPRRQ